MELTANEAEANLVGGQLKKENELEEVYMKCKDTVRHTSTDFLDNHDQTPGVQYRTEITKKRTIMITHLNISITLKYN